MANPPAPPSASIPITPRNGHSVVPVAGDPSFRNVARAIREAPDRDPSRGIQGMPPNFGEFVVPQVITLQGLLNAVSRTYRASDEALQHSWENARFMRTDCGIMECVEARQRSVALCDWHLKPEDDTSAKQKQLCDDMTAIIKRTPSFLKYRENLLHAVWYGRYAIQHRYQWESVNGTTRVVPKKWLPIHGDKLVFRFDDGSHEYDEDQIGIRVGLHTPLRGLFDQRRKIEPTERGMAYFLEPWERKILTVHKHMIEDGEYETAENAGRIHGLGVRSRIYWDWFQKQEALAWLMEYLERSAFGIELWFYPMGNAEAKSKTQEAANQRIGQGRNIVLVPKPAGEDSDQYGVQRIEPGLQGAEVLRDIIEKYFGHRIKRYILGQVLTSEAEATGLGSGVADLHLATFMDIVKYDAINLAETITTDLVTPLKEWNFPEAANVRIEFCIEVEKPDADKRLQAYSLAWQMGARVKEKDVLDAIGASIPTEQDRVLSNPAIAAAGGQDQATHPVTSGINAHHAAAPSPSEMGGEMSDDERAAREMFQQGA